MAERVEGPQGVEFDIHVYLTSNEGFEAVFSAKGAAGIPSADTAALIVESAFRGMPGGFGNWRVMTRDEIKDYKARQEEDVIGLGDEEEDF